MGALRPLKTTRRQFIAGALAAAALAGCKRHRAFAGGIVGAGAAAGHRLRDGVFPPATETMAADVVVIGGGIAGLAAARKLQQQGVKELVLLELEREPGGNAASGSNKISAYPWGAHYVPLPNPESVEVIELFRELGVITGTGADGLPIYDETVLCADPGERLFTCGRWQEGLLPQIGVTAPDRRQYASFFAHMEALRTSSGRDGRPAFAIPLDLSSRDPEWLALDEMTMARFMDKHGWTSAPLRWFVDYSCRDDYGTGLDHVSAWAGVHYFASRRGHGANAPRDAVLTWPEGNGWLAHRLAEPLGRSIRSQSIVWKIELEPGGVAIHFFDLAAARSIRIHARTAICAAPRFVAQRFIPGLAAETLEYSPWMVANITLDTLPAGDGAPLAWDNVLRESRSLGYIVATHQQLHPFPRQTVLTHYTPLDHLPPREARQQAFARSYESWCDEVLGDLERAHRGSTAHVTRLDVWLWGHGMIRPTPGFIWGEARQRMAASHAPIFFAHSDMSGISIFEEAYTRGVHAADAALAHLSS